MKIDNEEQVILHNKEHAMKLNITNEKPIYNSFVRCSSAVRKMMPMDPEQVVCTLLHIFDQFCKCPMKSYYIKKYFNNQNTHSKDISEFMLDTGKHKGRKDEKRLKKTVDEMKGQFTSLRKACQKANC